MGLPSRIGSVFIRMPEAVPASMPSNTGMVDIHMGLQPGFTYMIDIIAGA
jgi:hypothetical protein